MIRTKPGIGKAHLHLCCAGVKPFRLLGLMLRIDAFTEHIHVLYGHFSCILKNNFLNNIVLYITF